MKPDRVAIRILTNLIEGDLQLGWDHIQNGTVEGCDLALHEFHEACQKVEQIRDLITGQGTTAGDNLKRVNASNLPANDEEPQPQLSASASSPGAHQ